MDVRLPAESVQSERAAFIRRTYAHVAGSVLALVALEAILLQIVPGETIENIFLRGRWTWLLVMLAWMGASYVARLWANSATSTAMQYMGLGLYIVAWAVLFLPLIHVATVYSSDPNLIPMAGILTFAVFLGLTLTVLLTKKDFSFLRPVLCVGSLIALGVIVCSILFGFSLGLFFCFAMVALISGCILYDTSNVLHHYRTDQHVAAALELFASVAILFWYILQILMMLNRR
jgi:FtsH-binding integral membrane protein